MSYQNVFRQLGAGMSAGAELPIKSTSTVYPSVDDSLLKVGDGTNSFDLSIYGSAAANYISWDASANDLKFEDSVSTMWGTGAGAGQGNAGDVEARWDGTDFDILAAADDSVIKIGNGTNSFDLWLYGNTASDYVLWDASASMLSLQGAAGLNVGVVTVTDAASYTVLATNSGKTHVIPDLTATCTITLPTAAAGLEYVFIGKGVAADAQDWRFSTGGANFWLGGLAFIDLDAGAGADELSAVYPNGSSNDFITVVTPAAGTRVHIICDGTNWIVNGVVISNTTPAFADT